MYIFAQRGSIVGPVAGFCLTIHPADLPVRITMSVKSRLPEFLEKCERERDRAVDFWLQNSHDTEHGGFFVCLDRDGKVYDDTKYCWLQGRQVWMYCRLYNEVEKYHRQDVLQAAIAGGEFLMKHVRDPTTMKCSFAVTRDGRTVKVQRQPFSEVFYFLGLSELYRATGEAKYREEALKMMDQLVHWMTVDDSGLGRPKWPGAPDTDNMAVPMMLMCMIDQLEMMDSTLTDKYAGLAERCVEQLLLHIQRDGTVILEQVSPDGQELPGSLGRLQNPGHAIECSWFLLQYAVKHNRPDLKKTAINNFLLQPFESGWDDKHGGLFYFLDVDGYSPTQLEWNMKLWWPHNEALIAFLVAYKETKDEQMLEKFAKVFDYSFSHFVDPDHGEWYGYLSQQGEVTQRFKGGPFKGCFHVPRCLHMCTQILRELVTT
ncbi:N-acylglucosamine 2-epimerase-like isoform X2 [Branchiostoma lanceolatum]|uniref:N-acylglucosamine 2-epimerase-like isoform X2 n=1 Tax=Branchiostoma lanceolatum TaxID=7740 RepID=UPI00345665D9